MPVYQIRSPSYSSSTPQRILPAKMPPVNAAAISRVLYDIATFTPPLLTRSTQQEYLTKLTLTHKFAYYSATYGHTVHDAASLRKVLANTMRHHPNPAFGTAEGNAAVDTLFEFGYEMLEPEYVEEVKRAAIEEVVERREEEEEEKESSEEDDGALLGAIYGAGRDSEGDEDFVPAGRRLRRRETSGTRKRKFSASISIEESWRPPQRKKTKREHVMRSVAPPCSDATREPKVGIWRRSHVGDHAAASLSQHHEECGRGGAETAVDHHQKYRRSSGPAGLSPRRLLEQPNTHHETQADEGQANDFKLREAVERLNRRIQTAIEQLWDEIGAAA